MYTRLFLSLCLIFSSLSFNACAAPIKADETSHFMVLTDIHFDPYIACNNVVPCDQVDKLRAAPSSEWETILKQTDTQPAVYAKDTNFPLLTSALAEAKSEADAAKIRFVLVLGDCLGHSFKKNYQKYTGDMSADGYQAFVKKTLEFLTSEIDRAFPAADVYSVIGNNDSYQDDYFSDKQQGLFYHDIGQLWSSLVKDPTNKSIMQQEFNIQGYYAVDVADLRLVVLNSSLLSMKAQGADEGDADKEIAWLHNELATAAAKKQKVLIATHIPMGIDVFGSLGTNPYQIVEFWKPAYEQQVLADVKNYSANIIGILAGHTHVDWFQVLGSTPNEIPVSFTPAVSPQFGNNPGFKIFDFTSQQLTNFTTYFYALDAASPAWNREYSFSDVYKQDCVDCQLTTGMDRIQKTGPLADAYKYYFTAETNSQPITKDNKWLPYYWCAIRSITEADYQSCIGG